MDLPLSASPELEARQSDAKIRKNIADEYVFNVPRIDDRLHRIGMGLETLSALALAISNGGDISEEGYELHFIADALSENYNALMVAVSKLNEDATRAVLFAAAPTRYRGDVDE